MYRLQDCDPGVARHRLGNESSSGNAEAYGHGHIDGSSNLHIYGYDMGLDNEHILLPQSGGAVPPEQETIHEKTCLSGNPLHR